VARILFINVREPERIDAIALKVLQSKVQMQNLKMETI